MLLKNQGKQVLCFCGRSKRVLWALYYFGWEGY